MKRIFTQILILIAFSATLFAKTECTSCKQIIFKQNKGQWENNILYKAEIKNGAIFFEKNVITFNLFDTRDILRIKGDHHKLENHTPAIDYSMNFHAFKMKFENASEQSTSSGTETIKEYFNYFIGNDKTKWASKVQAFREIAYANLYNGIELKISSKENSLKYVYEVEKNTDASQLKINFEGTDGLSLDETGNLKINTTVGNVMDLKPYAYQLINGKEAEVPCQFTLTENRLSYNFPKGYDKQQKLFIDPILVFSTYSGSTADNFGHSATYDSDGNAFSAGTVFGVGYPLVTGHYIMSYQGGSNITFSTGGQYPGDDISITKYSANGTQRIFSTYLGGYGQELPHSLVVNSNNELYVLGTTDCPDYPVTSSAYDTSYNGGNDPGVWDGIAAHYKRGSDIVISRLSVDGSHLLSSTYVGGSDNDGLNYRAGQPNSSPGFLRHNYADEVRGEIEIDKNDNVYVASCTRSADFPRTTGTFQNAFGGSMDACVFKMDANLSTMIWSTTFGGSEDDAAYSVAIGGDENLFVAGGTLSSDFPVTNGVFQNSYAGGICDGFITHIDKNGQTKLASTYYGYSHYDQVYFVDLDKQNNVYVLGQADSSAGNYIRNAAYNTPNGGQFITKFNTHLDTLLWSTSWGRGIGVTDISPTAFLVDVCNNIYACGWGSQGVNNIVGSHGGTAGLNVTPNAYKTTTDGEDFYLMVMPGDASALSYATYMGGGISEEHVDGGTSRFDKKGVVYQSVCAGCGSNDDFPTTPGAVSTTNNSNNCNNAVFKFNLNMSFCVADFTYPNTCKSVPMQFSNQSHSILSPSYQWTFGDGGSSTQINPSHSFAQTGLYNVRLVISDPGSCNGTDTITRQVLVMGGTGQDTLTPITLCKVQPVQIGFAPNNDTTVVYQWSPTATLSAANISNPVATTSVSTNYRLLVSNGVCVDTFYQRVIVNTDHISLTAGLAICADTIILSVASTNGNSFIHYDWTPAGLIIAGQQTGNPSAVVFHDTTFYVVVETPQHCFFTDSVDVIVPSAVHAGFAPGTSGCINYPVTFTNQSVYYPSSTWQWIFGDGATSTQFNPTHTYSQYGLFEVSLIVSDAGTCNVTDTFTSGVLVYDTSPADTAPCSSHVLQTGSVLDDVIAAEIFPNPGNQTLSVRLNGPVRLESIVIWDESGKVVERRNYHDNNRSEIELDMTRFAAGVYFLKIQGNKEVFIKRWIKQVN